MFAVCKLYCAQMIISLFLSFSLSPFLSLSRVHSVCVNCMYVYMFLCLHMWIRVGPLKIELMFASTNLFHIYLFEVYYYVYLLVHVLTCYSTHVEVRRHLVEGQFS